MARSACPPQFALLQREIWVLDSQANTLPRGVVALQEAINQFVATHNRDPKPFVWKADPNAIIAAGKRGYQALDSIH